MCGIVAGVSGRDIVPVLVQGLQRLEYRGYDSCGVAVHTGAGLLRSRSTARVAELQAQVVQEGLSAGTGIAHTRWATHGAPLVHNAHPHFSHGPGDASARPARVASCRCKTMRASRVSRPVARQKTTAHRCCCKHGSKYFVSSSFFCQKRNSMPFLPKGWFQ